MDKIDILRENLYIKRIITVVKGQNPQMHKLLSVNSRHSDAFIYIISGSCTYRFSDGSEFLAGEGDVFYLPHRAYYNMYIHTKDYSFIFCDFEFAEEKERKSFLCSSASLKNIDNLFIKLLNKYSFSSGTGYAECMSILYSIYGILKQNTEQSYLGKNKSTVINAKRYIDENFGNAYLNISDLAEKNGISEVYLRKLFREAYGISPIKYLNSIRLKNAKELMKYPFLTLEACAMQSGFTSLQYFSRIFKKETGITPGKYRRDL